MNRHTDYKEMLVELHRLGSWADSTKEGKKISLILWSKKIVLWFGIWRKVFPCIFEILRIGPDKKIFEFKEIYEILWFIKCWTLLLLKIPKVIAKLFAEDLVSVIRFYCKARPKPQLNLHRRLRGLYFHLFLPPIHPHRIDFFDTIKQFKLVFYSILFPPPSPSTVHS